MSKGKTKRRDELTTVAQLKSLVEEFVAQRDWAQFHSPKNLAMAIGVEAGELMDLFRWHSEAQSVQAMKNGKARKRAAEELADVVICALAFANRTGINLAQVVTSKVSKNSKKYPLRTYKGRF
jgi:NTP pyrophosphatase (non-canonical NTP hydrolase)